jgi:hypothetical protein
MPLPEHGGREEFCRAVSPQRTNSRDLTGRNDSAPVSTVSNAGRGGLLCCFLNTVFPLGFMRTLQTWDLDLPLSESSEQQDSSPMTTG